MGVVGEALAHGTEKQARRRATAARSHDEERGVVCLLDEHRGGMTFDRERFSVVGAAVQELRERVAQHTLRVLFGLEKDVGGRCERLAQVRRIGCFPGAHDPQGQPA